MRARTIRRVAVLAVISTILLAAGRGLTLLQQAPPKDSARQSPLRQLSQPERERAVTAGRKLFLKECAECHGNGAEGSRFAPPLASVTIRQATEGSIFWILRNGGMKRGMPSFAHLPDHQRWQIVAYLKSM